MSWSYAHWSENDSILYGLPYPTEMTQTIIDHIDNNNIKFFVSLGNVNYFGLPVSSTIKNNLVTYGTCRGLYNLTSVKIPESVKYIDYLSFYDTGLTEVTIANDCVYQDSSFPAGCTINYYT